MILELLLIAVIISVLIWFFGVDGIKIFSVWLGCAAIIVAGIILGIGVQLSYIIFPISGG